MSETVARQRPSVDLDAFERRMRQTHHEDDPLAELARIVGDAHDPYGDVFAQQPTPVHEDLRASYAPHDRQEPSLGRPEPSHGGEGPRFLADFAAIEAGLRGAQPQMPPEPQLHPQVAPGHDAQPDYAEPDYAFPPEPEVGAMPGARQPAPAPARQKPVYGVAAAIVLAVAGIGVAFAYKGTSSSPREIKTIMASAGPTKVQPPADAKADAADQDSAALGQAPTKLVSREEQPVDLQQAVQDNAARDAASRGTDASSVPVPPSPGGTMSPDYSATGGQTPDASSAGTASPTYSDQGFGVGMPLPKKVRSVSVKPDGTIVPGAPDDAAATPAAKPEDRIGALAQDSSPASAPAPKPARPSKAAKSTSRVATAAPPPAPAGDDVADAPASKPAKPARKTKPVQVGTAETSPDQAQANDANDDAKPAAGSGAYAVQLAAPGSESDARSMTTKLLKKYNGALHGRRLGFHRADSNGHTVYRIRVSSLTKEDASSLCGKLKADGGSCFIAKN